MEKKLQRLTKQRKVILEVLKNIRTHPTADEVYQMVKKTVPNMSLGTVYRNLEILSQCGLIRKIETGGGPKRFDGNINDHQHVRCIECGRLDDIQCESLDLRNEISGIHCGYEIVDCNVEFLGICPRCQERRKKEKERKGAGSHGM